LPFYISTYTTLNELLAVFLIYIYIIYIIYKIGCHPEVYCVWKYWHSHSYTAF